MCIVAQCDNALHDFVDDDDTVEKLCSILFKRYNHDPSPLHSFKLMVISMEPVVYTVVKKMVGKRVSYIKETIAYIKARTKHGHVEIQIFTK